MEDFMKEMREFAEIMENKENIEKIYLDFLITEFAFYEKRMGEIINFDDAYILEIMIKHFDKIDTKTESRFYTLLRCLSQPVIRGLKEHFDGLVKLDFGKEAPVLRELEIGEKYSTEELRENQRINNEYKKEVEDFKQLAYTRHRISEFIHTHYTEDLYKDQTFGLDNPYIYYTFFEFETESIEVFIREVIKARFTELELIKRIYIDDVSTSYPAEFKAKKVKFFFESEETMNVFFEQANHILEALFLRYKLMKDSMAKTDSIVGKYNESEKNNMLNLNSTIGSPSSVSSIGVSSSVNNIEDTVKVSLSDCYYYNDETDRVIVVDKEFFDSCRTIRRIEDLEIEDMPSKMVRYNTFSYSVDDDAKSYIESNAEFNNDLSVFLSYTQEQQEIISYMKSEWGIDITDGWFDVTISENDGDLMAFVQPVSEKGFDQDLGDITAFIDLEMDEVMECVYLFDNKLTIEEIVESFKRSPYFTISEINVDGYVSDLEDEDD
jgi:hypothetical protein